MGTVRARRQAKFARSIIVVVKSRSLRRPDLKVTMTSIGEVIISGKEIAAALLSERRRTRARPEKKRKSV